MLPWFGVQKVFLLCLKPICLGYICKNWHANLLLDSRAHGCHPSCEIAAPTISALAVGLSSIFAPHFLINSRSAFGLLLPHSFSNQSQLLLSPPSERSDGEPFLPLRRLSPVRSPAVTSYGRPSSRTRSGSSASWHPKALDLNLQPWQWRLLLPCPWYATLSSSSH